MKTYTFKPSELARVYYLIEAILEFTGRRHEGPNTDRVNKFLEDNIESIPKVYYKILGKKLTESQVLLRSILANEHWNDEQHIELLTEIFGMTDEEIARHPDMIQYLIERTNK